MNHVLLTIDEVNQKIKAGKKLLLAGDENALAKLEKGSWIAGTIPYFVGQDGGEFNQEKIFVTELPDYVTGVEIKVYDETTIQSIYTDAPDHGFVAVIIPATSKTHLEFAVKAPEFPEFATRPVAGWIAGVFLNDLGKITPKVFNGQDGSVLENAAVAMSVSLPENKIAELGIVNIFEQGDGDTLVFPEDGFSATDVNVNGKTVKLADYIKENNIDTKSPLVANFYGANINISFQQIAEEEKRVDFYAPVFKGVAYKLAKSVPDYASEFKNKIPELGDTVAFSCNCIMNYLYGELEGKKTGAITGPITFGEIAYQLLNQTLVYLAINDK
jgi:hypothetical protein